MIRLLFAVCLISFSSVCAQTARTALVIGNSAYRSSPLKNPVHDAEDISFVLGKLGFKVLSAYDCERSEMRKNIRLFYNEIKAGGIGLFYYAGHGLQLNGENFLVPVNADINEEFEIEDQCITLSSVLSAMASANNGTNIVILDACRNNPFSAGYRSVSRGLAKVNAPVGTFLAYATAPGSVALDSSVRGLKLKRKTTEVKDRGNGLYTAKLLKYMVQPDLSIENVFKKVRIEVMNATEGKQIPWESSSLTAHFSFGGDVSLLEVENVPELTVPRPKPGAGKKRAYYDPDSGSYKNSGTVRFKWLSDNSLKDSQLNCTWKIIEEKIFTIDEAEDYAEDHYPGYRLPTKSELRSLLTRKKLSDEWGYINGEFFKEHSRTTKYWTSSQFIPLWPTAGKTYIDFSNGAIKEMAGSNNCAVILIKK